MQKHTHTSPREEKKRTYQEELQRRCEDTFNEMAEDDKSGWPQLYEFVKDVALDSFKSGVRVGKRRAQEGGDKSKDLVAEEGQ